MSTSVPAVPGHFPDHDAFAAYVERYGPRLLLWIWDRAEGELDRQVSCAEFVSLQSIPVNAVRAVVDHLRADELISTSGEPGQAQGAAPVVTLRAAGAEQARRLQALRADPARRTRHAVQSVLHWIHANTHRQPLRISGFLDSPDVFFLGEALSRSEVARALGYLAAEELITCEGPLFHHDVGAHVALTPKGMAAVLSGERDIGAYLARRHEQRRPTQHTHIEAGTIQNITQGNADHSVHNNLELHTALPPAGLARLITEMAPALELDPESRTNLLHIANQLTEGSEPGGEPQPDRQRTLMERARGLLGSAAPDTVGRQVLLDMVGQALGRLLGG